LLLPAGESDLSFVLLSGTMLRKQARPGLRIGANLDVVLGRQLLMNFVPGHDGFHGGRALRDDPGIFPVERDPQPEDVSPAS
jgi:hypothetical protein